MEIMQQELVYKTLSKLDKEKKLLLGNEDISKKNKDLIIDYIQQKKFEGKKENTILRYHNRFKLLALKFNKDFTKATKKDINELIISINDSNLSNATKAQDKGLIKDFYKWLGYPKLVEDIIIKRETKKRAPSEILSEEDILAMINATSNIRNKAIIAVLTDSGVFAVLLLQAGINKIESDNKITKIVGFFIFTPILFKI